MGLLYSLNCPMLHFFVVFTDRCSVDSFELQPESTSDVETLLSLPQDSAKTAVTRNSKKSCFVRSTKSSQTLKCCRLLHVSWNSRLVLFLTRGGLFVFGVIILIIGGVLSQHTPSTSYQYQNSTDCHTISNTTFES